MSRRAGDLGPGCPACQAANLVALPLAPDGSRLTGTVDAHATAMSQGSDDDLFLPPMPAYLYCPVCHRHFAQF